MPSIEGIKMMEASRPARPMGGPRQLYVIRHGERVDFTFGKDWVSQSFDTAGKFGDHSVYAASQWEMALHSNAISHWLDAYTEWSL